MGNEAESIGGISVSASIDDSKVDGELTTLLTKLEEAAQKGFTIPAHVVAAQGGGTGTQGASHPATRAAPTTQAAPSPRRVVPPPTPQAYAEMAYSSMRPRGGAGGGDYDLLGRRIAEAAAKDDAALGRVAVSAQKTTRTRQAAFVQEVHASPAAEPLVLAVSTTEAKTQLAAFLVEFKAEMAQAQASATIQVKVDRPTTGATTGSGRSGRRGGRAGASTPTPPSPSSGGMEEDEEEKAARIRYNRHGAPVLDIQPGEDLGSTNVSRTNQRLSRYGVQPIRITGGTGMGQSIAAQRKRDGAAKTAARQTAQKAAQDREISDREARHRDLTELSYLNQAEGTNVPGGGATGFAGRQRTSAEIEAARRADTAKGPAFTTAGRTGGGAAAGAPTDSAIARDERVRMRARAAAAGGGPTGSNAPPPNPAFSPDARAKRSQQLADDAELRRQQQGRNSGPTNQMGRASADARAAADEAAIKSSRGGRTQGEAEREVRIQANIERQRAGITAAGRTGRTESFGLGALFGGTQGKFIEASKRQSVALGELNSAMSAGEPIRKRIAVMDDDISRATGARVGILQKERQAFVARRDVAPILEREVSATKNLEKANLDLQKLQGPSSIARNLLAGAAGGAAFGIAMAGISEVVKTLAPALGDVADRAGGFTSKSTAVTSALAQQTAAQKGNVDAAIAQAAATAGLSAETADYLSTQLKLTTQVKAGALAEGQAGDLFRGTIGAKQAVPQGLLGGFGGIGGGSLLAGTIGGGQGTAEEIAGTFGAFSSATTRAGESPNGPTLAGKGFSIRTPAQATDPTPAQTQEIARLAKDRNKYETDLNDAAKRGSMALGDLPSATAHFASITQAQADQIAQSGLPQELKDTAKSLEGLKDSSGNLITSYGDAIHALEQVAVGRGIQDIATMGRAALAAETGPGGRQAQAQASIPAMQAQFAYERPAFLASTQRQQQLQQFTQLPAQQALQNLAQPLLPTSTGIVGANRKEQDRINADLKGANDLQGQLNTKYAEGQKVIADTYKATGVKEFGQAWGQAFQSGLDAVTATGKQIANLQSGIVNEQANYEVAQYNYQLFIAKRSLSDIGGLTGRNFGAGQSYLGVLEKQNLQLSRQGQQLQFNLSQRQINFQTALAGFQAPGVTPEERQANVKEAQLEAGYAQKQLDIQKQMFGNQVQIVDIQNLRQGVDLSKQIGLLTRGRQVTIDVKVKTAELERAQALQQQQVAAAGTYLSQIDNVVNHDFAQMTALETAAGKAMFGAAKYAVGAFNQYLAGVIGNLESFANQMNPQDPANSGRQQDPAIPNAAGALFNTGGGAVGMMTVGENDRNETVAILRNPRSMGYGGEGGSGSVTINFGGVSVRDNADIDTLVRKVTTALGRQASLKGLRSN